MKTPMFSQSEEVIVKSIDLPQYNGDYSIAAVYLCDLITCRVTGDVLWYDDGLSGVSYHLDPIVLNTEGNEVVWDQSALRKKHKPPTALRKKHKAANKSLSRLILDLNKELVT